MSSIRLFKRFKFKNIEISPSLYLEFGLTI
jgi:hypothetical protein